MTDKAIRVLIVDDRLDDREFLAARLRLEDGFEVDTTNDGNDALSQIKAAQGQYDVILMDNRLGGDPDGIETMKRIKQDYPSVETIIITGYAGIEDGIRAMKGGAYTYVVKPLRYEEIVVHIRSAAERRKLAKEREFLKCVSLSVFIRGSFKR